MDRKEITLRDLQAVINKFCDDRDWDKFHNLKDLSISLSLEAAELLEHFQWKNIDEIDEHLAKNKSEVGSELADILYWVLLIANKLDIDLIDTFDRKMEKNAAKYPVNKAKGNHLKYTEHQE